jgi:hypothetical protein
LWAKLWLRKELRLRIELLQFLLLPTSLLLERPVLRPPWPVLVPQLRLRLRLLRTELRLREELLLRTKLWLREELRLWAELRLREFVLQLVLPTSLLLERSVLRPPWPVLLPQLRLRLRLRTELRLRAELWLRR